MQSVPTKAFAIDQKGSANASLDTKARLAGASPARMIAQDMELVNI